MTNYPTLYLLSYRGINTKGGIMMDITKDKKTDIIKFGKNLVAFLVCFIISRYSVIGGLFPLAVITMCSYCYICGASFIMLCVCSVAVVTGGGDMLYVAVLAGVWVMFAARPMVREKKPLLTAAYVAAVLFSLKTADLIIVGFGTAALFVNIFEALFVMSGTVLVCEAEAVLRNKSLAGFIERMRGPAEETDTEAGEEAVSAVGEAAIPMPAKRKVRETVSDDAKNKIRELLSWEDVRLRHIDVSKDNSGQTYLSVTAVSDRPADKVQIIIADTVRAVCGLRLKYIDRVATTSGYSVYRFKSVRRVRIRTCAATAVKDGSDMSGDCYTYAGRADRYYAVLCDGMGSGSRAYEESSSTVDMLENLLRTDFTEQQVIRTLNSLMVLKLEEERYVTFDMQIIDYSTHEVRFYKAGASPSFIISGDTVEKIEGRSLPMGVFENFEYSKFKRVVRRGDIIIMVSDGIIDSIASDDRKNLSRYIETVKTRDAQTIANSILSYALRGCTEIIDDMTVLVTQVR